MAALIQRKWHRGTTEIRATEKHQFFMKKQNFTLKIDK